MAEILDQKAGSTTPNGRASLPDPYSVINRQPTAPSEEAPNVLKQLDTQQRGSGAFRQRDQSDIKKHDHDGTNSEKIDIKKLKGLIEVLTAVPTSKPTMFYEQLKIVVTGGFTYLYIFDPVADDWLGVQLTT